MREVDRLMVEEVGISLPQMMENAGRGLALQARVLLHGDVLGRRVIVLAGPGGNGGGGLAAARRLSVWGAEVEVVIANPSRHFADASAHQLAALRWMGARILETGSVGESDLILDAIFGYSVSGAPSGRPAELIDAANSSPTPILALDLPSGLHPDSGEAFAPAIRAAATVTLALPKTGLVKAGAKAWVGDLYLADISVPERVYQRLGLEVGPVFAQSDVIAI
jgi:NAD(P)H-hydrate epimerase